MLKYGKIVNVLLTLFACYAMESGAGTLPTSPHAVSPHWTGVYAGAHGGYAWSNTAWVFVSDQYFNLANGNSTFTTSPRSGTAGGHVGLNYQVHSALIGIEASADSAFAMEQTRTGVLTILFPNDEFRTRLDNYYSITARLGFAHEQWLPYLRGGFASAKVTLDALSGTPGAGVHAAVHERHSGWTIGGGIEHHLIPSIVLGVQYDYMKFPRKMYTTTTTGPEIEPFAVELQPLNVNALSARISIQLDGITHAPAMNAI